MVSNRRTASGNLRVCVVGAGRMGADHIHRLAHRIVGAQVAAVVDVNLARAKKAVETIPPACAVSNIGEAFDQASVNAVLIATPGLLHEEALLQSDAASKGEIGGPTACDGYATAACCQAGLTAQKSGQKVEVSLQQRPSIYH